MAGGNLWGVGVTAAMILNREGHDAWTNARRTWAEGEFTNFPPQATKMSRWYGVKWYDPLFELAPQMLAAATPS
jgi:hypothetical protein